MPIVGSFAGASARAYGLGTGKKPKTVFAGGNQSVSDLRTLMETLTVDSLAIAPTAGGTLTVNSVALGSYDYTIKSGNQTVSAFSSTDFFTATENTRSALIAIDGNLTIDSGQTFVPSVRKLFTAIYVKGDLTINGVLSMSSKGASHSATAEGVVLLKVGTSVAATGASGGDGGPGNSNRGFGAAGTIFTGGAAGGGASAGNDPTPGATRGGSGGNGGGGSNFNTAGGGAGNPGGNGAGPGVGAGGTGTGGTLFIYCTGTVSGTGSITTNAAVGGAAGNGEHRRSSGGGAGGGHVTVMRGLGNVTISTTGGAAGARNNPPSPEGTSGAGNSGGTGTNQVIAL